jgi:hypothetical protein
MVGEITIAVGYEIFATPVFKATIRMDGRKSLY